MNKFLIDFCLISVSVVLNNTGQLLLKSGSGQKFLNLFGVLLPINIYLLTGIMAYRLSTVCDIFILHRFHSLVRFLVIWSSTRVDKIELINVSKGLR